MINKKKIRPAKLHAEHTEIDVNEAHRLIAENYTRILALEDSFEVLYDVELETGRYDIFVKGQTFGDVNNNLINNNSFFDDVEKNLNVVHPEDRQGNYDTTRPDFIRKALSEDDHFDRYYRLMVDGVPAWARMRIVYKDAEKKNIIIGVFNAENDVESKQIAEQKEQLEIQQKQLKEQLARVEESSRIISSLSEDFGCVVYVEITDGESHDIGTNYRVSELLKKTIPGWEKETSFSRKVKLLLDYVVYEPDKAHFRLSTSRSVVLENLKDSDVFFVNFRLVVENEIRYYQMKFSAVRENGRLIGVVAGLHSVDEQMKRELESQKKYKEAEDAEKLVQSVAGIYRFAFAVDMAGSYFKVIRMDDEVKRALTVSEFHSYQEALMPLLGWIHPGDRDRMANELNFNTVRERLKSTVSYNVEYRVINKGSTEWHEMKVTHITADEVAMGFGEKDLEITKRHIEDRRFSDCFGVYEADLDTGLFKVIVDSPYYTFSETGEAVPYSAAMRKFAESQVGETREFFLKLADKDWVKKTLSTDNKHSFTYYSVTAGNTWVDVTSYVTMRHEDGTPAMFALEFSFVSSAGAARQEMQRRLNESSQIISGLASGYLALYFVNLDEGLFSVYSLDTEKYPKTAKIVGEGNNPFETLRAFGASDIVHPDDRHLFAEMSPELFRERLADQKKFSIRFRRIDGDAYIWNEMDVVKSEDTDARANALIVGFTDCDEEIRRELEQQRQLEEALALAKSASNAKTEFLFNMSHDIRTPMNAILGYTDIALNHINEPERVDDSLKKIKTSGGHLLSLINDILEMSRIEAGRLEIVSAPLNAYDVSEGVINMSQALAAAKDITFNADINNLKNPYIYADELHINQVIINLISNAVKYTNPGGTVDYRIEQISDPEGGIARYRLTVKDNGIGMSEEFQTHLFESFAREKTATVSRQEGAGLGLAIVKKIVDLIGGTISAESKQGVGSTFTVELPLKVMDEAAIAEYKASRNKGSEIREDLTLEGMKVLIVEDNEMNREIAAEILEEIGMETDTAEDGAIAVRKVWEKGIAYYDFILMDIQMPVMNGYEATAAIRKLPDGDRVPIIALSANAFKEDVDKSLAAGMNAHVAKPIDINLLQETIRGLTK